MGTPNLRAQRLGAASAAVLAMTALGAALSTIDPRLVGSTAPHPVLTGSLTDALSILQNNLRVLAAPFLLWLLRFPESRSGRHAGDLIVLVIAARSAITVGLELGRWHTRLLPYLPQLPVEWAALTVATSAWLTARTEPAARRQLATLAALTTILLTLAAGIETYATPHRKQQETASLTEPARAHMSTPSWMPARCLRHGFCTGHGPVAPRSHAPFPSPKGSVPLGRPAGADRATSTTSRPPPGGTS